MTASERLMARLNKLNKNTEKGLNEMKESKKEIEKTIKEMDKRSKSYFDF